MATISRSERIDLRVTPEFKKVIAEAASLASMTVSEYIISKIYKASLEEININKLAMWSIEDLSAALKLLDMPLTKTKMLTELENFYEKTVQKPEYPTLKL
jgi:uncharacterized protein (DUF1778 family)